MKKVFVAAMLVLIFLSSCGPSPVQLTATADSALRQTQTAAPTNTPIPTVTPTLKPTTTPTATPDLCFNTYPLPKAKSEIGRIDGVKFSKDALNLASARVEITGKAVSAGQFLIPDALLDGTMLVVSIPGDDGKEYYGGVYLKDGFRFGGNQFLPGTELNILGVHLGILVRDFTDNPGWFNVGLIEDDQYAVIFNSFLDEKKQLPWMVAEVVTCAQPH